MAKNRFAVKANSSSASVKILHKKGKIYYRVNLSSNSINEYNQNKFSEEYKNSTKNSQKEAVDISANQEYPINKNSEYNKDNLDEQSTQKKQGGLEKSVQKYLPFRRIKRKNSLLTEEEKTNISPAEARRLYQRRYYQNNKERAKEYQRQYNRTHKKSTFKNKGKNTNFTCPRELIKTSYNGNDLQEAPGKKFEEIIRKILKREVSFAGFDGTPGILTERKYLPVVEKTTIIDK